MTVRSGQQSGSTVRDWVRIHPVVAFVAGTYLLSWSLWLIAFRFGGDESVIGSIFFVAGGLGPAVAAAIVLILTGGSLRAWGRSIVKWRVPVRFWLYALGLPVLLLAAANLMLMAFGEPVDWSLLGSRVGPYLGTFAVTLFLLGGLEEPGWRGFALPRLQQRFTPFKATLVIGVVWGLWHLPLGVPNIIVPFFLAFFYTWLYNRTGSVLLAILLHASFTPAQDHLLLLPEEVHGAGDVAIGVAYLVGVALMVALTRGRLGFNQWANAARVNGEPDAA
jgi:membrane protease YdiL (CAAX protease family)